MEWAGKFLCVLASSTLWLSASSIVLWLFQQSRFRLSPGTRAAASLLIVLQGWIWIGIPVRLDPAWISPKAAGVSLQSDLPIEAIQALAPRQIDTPSDLAPSSMASARLVAGAALAAIWMAGIFILLWRSIRGFVALSQMISALPNAPPDWQNELTTLCRQQSIGRKVLLKISNVATPMLAQTWGPVCIVFPAWLWKSCSDDQRTSILLHELAHYRRGDLWRQLAVRLLVLPHWFNPLAWWAAGQFEAASEAACDEAACGSDPVQAISYSKALLVLNERLGIRYVPALAISGGSLTERIRRILHPEFRKESQMSRVLILSAMTVLAGLATIRIQAVEQSPEGERIAARDVPAKAPAASLLPNGGFEEAQEKSDDPQGWYATRIPYPRDKQGKAAGPVLAGHYLIAASPSVAHGGKRSVYVAIGDSHPETKVAYNWTAVADGWQVGDTYELSGWIKVENTGYTAFIMAQFWDEESKTGKMLGGATTQFACPIKGTTDWTRVSTRLTVPAGTSVLRIRAGLSSEGNPGAKAWFDDISLVKVAN